MNQLNTSMDIYDTAWCVQVNLEIKRHQTIPVGDHLVKDDNDS